jgi:hypothetical protein
MKSATLRCSFIVTASILLVVTKHVRAFSWISISTNKVPFVSSMTTIQKSFAVAAASRHDYADIKRSEQIRTEWIDSSIQYYSKVMREERRRSVGQFKEVSDIKYYTSLARKHYFALRKIKDGKPHQAESIYRRIIHQLLQELKKESKEEDHCDHSKLAVTTLLLALHLQRNNASPKETRSVFLNFFRVVMANNEGEEECACSAKVLQAFALFEMKQGNALKSLELVNAAIKLDPTLKSVLNWKQFRDAMQRRVELQMNQSS